MRSSLTVLIFSVLYATQPAKLHAQAQYDAVVVGAGMSGLAAAYALNDKNVLVLEKQNRIGGRVYTKKFKDIYYELGAYAAYPTEPLPFDDYKPSKLIRGEDSIGILLNKKIHHCAVPLECMYKVGFSVDDIEHIKSYDEKQGIDFSQFANWKVEIMNSFFNMVQSGDIRNYNPKRQRDAFKLWTTDHYLFGNGELAYEFRSRLNNPVRLGAEVTNIKDLNNHAEVTYVEDGNEFTVTARSVIVCTPAPVTVNLVENLDSEVRSMLNNITFNPHSVYVMIMENDKLPDFNYLATPELYSSTVVQSKTNNPSIRVYYIHFSHNKATRLQGYSERKLYVTAKGAMESLFGKKFREDRIVHTDYAYWNIAATVVDDDYYSDWNRKVFHPGKHIFLAGDYLDLYGFPLGINAAIQSGLRAGKETREFLKP